MKNLIFILSLLLTAFFAGNNVHASTCLTIGDSQSSGPIHGNYGMIPRLHSLLLEKGYDVVTLAMPGSGAYNWAYNNAWQIDFFFKDKENSPYQKSTFSMANEFRFSREGSGVSFFDQAFNFFQKKRSIECLIIQLGDNDLRKNNGAIHMAKLIQSVSTKKGINKCGIMLPTWDEDGKKDKYPKIDWKLKIDYRLKLYKELKKEGLLNICELISTTGKGYQDCKSSDLKCVDYDQSGREFKRSLGPNFTPDGLHIQSTPGKKWAEFFIAEFF